MKSYKKGFLALSVIALMPMSLLMANTVQDDRIKVTTFADEDGENPAACSLREALKASEYNQPYGGCNAGKTHPSVTDNIVLEKGEYILHKTLLPNSQVNLSGAEMEDWSAKDIVTGTYPARVKAVSSIKGDGTFSLINTASGKASLTLNNLLLDQGGGKRGGAIYAGGGIYLNKVEIKNSKASEMGGAIYLAGVGSLLQANDSIFSNNQSSHGAVVAMSCIDNLTFTKRDIGFFRSTILNNGDNTTGQVIELCGNVTAEFINNTITLNKANTSQGSILKFTGDSRPGTNEGTILNNGSTLTLQNNTIINNTAYATFLYDSLGSKSLSYNLLAYNQGYSCRHLLGASADLQSIKMSLVSNALSKTASNIDYCQAYYPTDEKTDSTNTVDVSKIAQNSVLLPLQLSSQYSSFLPVYFLKEGAKNPLKDPSTSLACAETDQRNKKRTYETELLLESKSVMCDIGAIEQTALRANDLQQSNLSQVVLIEGFKKEHEFFKELVENKATNKDFLPYYEVRVKEFEDKLNNYPKSFRYRQSYYDVFATSEPHELINASGALEVQHFDQNLYNVQTEALGLGPDVFASKEADDLPKVPDPALKCEWQAALKQVVMYRTDGQINQAGDFGYCKYTVSLKSDPTIKSSGILQATFQNIVPVAVDDRYDLKWGTEQRTRLDLLANDHDDGDGKKDAPFYPKDKPTFFVNTDGTSTPIKLGKIDSSLVIEAQYQAACPDESGDICYGGEIYITPKNSYNKFNYSFTYQVFDADSGISNEATVRLVSTATTSEDSRKGGGGSLGGLALLGLAGLALWRRKYH